MSTSDQQDHGPLTRKQLREIRLTGSTPVITPEEAASATETAPPTPPLPGEDESADTAIDSVSDDSSNRVTAPLTRRQVREQERLRTGSVAVTGTDAESVEEGADAPSDAPQAGEHEPEEPQEEEPQREDPSAEEAPAETVPAEQTTDELPDVEERPQSETPQDTAEESSPIVSGLPDFTAPQPADDTAGDDDDIDDEIVIEPVRAADMGPSVGVVPLEVVEEPAGDEGSESEEHDDVVAVLGIDVESTSDAADVDDVLADVDDAEDDGEQDPRPTVNPAFGEGVLTDAPEPRSPFNPSFDELLTVGDSTGSQHSAPNALIFTPSPGGGSLSGPVASTGEILVTGSYELPQGLGSQGHAHGTTDGKDIDSVLIDGELPPASSPTPIAASAAVSTIKPAGEVIRPPAPEKGNKLMLILAIVAGGLALALGVALVFAFTTNVF